MATAYLSSVGLYVRDNQLREVFGTHYGTVFARLTATYRPDIGMPIVAHMYKRVLKGGEMWIGLPRAALAGFMANGAIVMLEINFKPTPMIPAKLIMEPLPHQRVIVDYIMANKFAPELANAGRATCTLNLQAGRGKTFVSAMLIAKLQMRTLYIVTMKHLAQQAKDDFNKYLSGITVGKDIVILVINTALKKDDAFFNGFGFVVFDECHTLCSPTRREIFWKAHTPFMMAMSATTDHRIDGFDVIYKRHLGDVVYADKIPLVGMDTVKFNLQIKIINYVGPPAYTRHLTCESTGKMACTKMYKQFAEDPYRNQLICDEIIDLYHKGNFIYVFSEERAFAASAMDRIAAILGPEGISVEDELGYFVGGIKMSDAEKIKNRSRIVFTTFRMAGTGTSWIHMTAMVLITPRKSGAEQLAARIMRLGGDITAPRIIVDIVDARTGLRKQRVKRIVAYKFYKAKISEHIIAYRDIKLAGQQDVEEKSTRNVELDGEAAVEAPAEELPNGIIEVVE